MNGALVFQIPRDIEIERRGVRQPGQHKGADEPRKVHLARVGDALLGQQGVGRAGRHFPAIAQLGPASHRVAVQMVRTDHFLQSGIELEASL